MSLVIAVLKYSRHLFLWTRCFSKQSNHMNSALVWPVIVVLIVIGLANVPMLD